MKKVHGLAVGNWWATVLDCGKVIEIKTLVAQNGLFCGREWQHPILAHHIFNSRIRPCVGESAFLSFFFWFWQNSRPQNPISPTRRFNPWVNWVGKFSPTHSRPRFCATRVFISMTFPQAWLGANFSSFPFHVVVFINSGCRDFPKNEKEINTVWEKKFF